jgi:hypothetical protein
MKTIALDNSAGRALDFRFHIRCAAPRPAPPPRRTTPTNCGRKAQLHHIQG